MAEQLRRPHSPESNRTIPSRGMEGRRNLRLDISAPPRPESRPDGGVITPDSPVAPTTPRPDTTPKQAPEQKPAKPKHTVRNISLATTSLVGLGAVGIGVYETVPAVHTAVDSFANSFNDIRLVITDFFTAPSLEERFPNQMPQNTFIPLSPEEELELWTDTKTVNLENHTFTLGFPVNQDIINQSPDLRINSYFEPELFLGVSNISELERAGIKNVNQISGFPKDTPIYFRYNQSRFSASVIKIGIAGETKGGSYTPAYTTFRIFLRDIQTGYNFDIIVSGLYASPLIETKDYPTDHSAVFEDGTLITPDTPIFQLTTDLQDWNGTNQVLPGQGGQITLSNVGGVKANPNPSGVPILTPVFLKTPTGNIATRQ